MEELAIKAWLFHREVSQNHKARWLSMVGSSGTGKTHCAKRLWELLRPKLRWHRAEYLERVIYWPKFVEELRQRVHDGLGMEPLLDLMRWPLLVLDDIGAEHDKSGFATEKLNMLIGSRIGRWTIITSNLTLEGLGKIDDRISDRIIREPGNDWIEMTCDSYGVSKATP